MALTTGVYPSCGGLGRRSARVLGRDRRQSDDVLHLRDVPSAESRSLAGIPPNAHGLKHLGCRRNELALEQWMRMTKEQRQAAQTLWCRVEYRGTQGWVAGRYLKKDDVPAR